MDRCTGGLRAAPFWWFDSLLWGISSGFPLASHPDLPGSEPVLGVSQDPPMGAWVCISRPMGRLRTIALLTSKELSSWEGFLDFKNEKYVVSYQQIKFPKRKSKEEFSGGNLRQEGNGLKQSL